MDLIGKFKLSPQGHQYAFGVIDMLKNYTLCLLLHIKQSNEVVHSYLANVYSKFGGSNKILSDNGIEFKNKFFVHVVSILVIKQICSSSFYCNGYIENVHNFLKTCIHKHVSSQLAWDEVAHLAFPIYNLVPNEHSQESVFFLMFGRNTYMLLMNFSIQRLDIWVMIRAYLLWIFSATYMH